MNKKKRWGFMTCLLMFTLLLTGCELVDRSLTDMGIVKNESGERKSISQEELEEYNRLAQEAYEKGVDPHEYAKEQGWSY